VGNLSGGGNYLGVDWFDFGDLFDLVILLIMVISKKKEKLKWEKI
jgi:hypothetical protein